jgi:hypothetical protein
MLSEWLAHTQSETERSLQKEKRSDTRKISAYTKTKYAQTESQEVIWVWQLANSFLFHTWNVKGLIGHS